MSAELTSLYFSLVRECLDSCSEDRTEGAMFLVWMFPVAAAFEVADDGVRPVGIAPTG